MPDLFFDCARIFNFENSIPLKGLPKLVKKNKN